MKRLGEWLAQNGRPDRVWYAKRLSGNDTLANGAHQAGPYISRDFLNSRFPSLDRPNVLNPDVWFSLYIDSHSEHRRIRAVWYNNHLHGGTRNESRLTNFGGASSPLLDPESTGALAIFAFESLGSGDSSDCRVWICQTEAEEDLAEDLIGPVEPGRAAIWSSEHGRIQVDDSAVDCWLRAHEIPAAWIEGFPSGAEMLSSAVALRPKLRTLDPDARLIARRECEYQLFRSVEEAIELPGIRAGFDTLDEFVARAQRVLQRRKARSGRSFELHVRQILDEEGLHEGVDFTHGGESEPGRKPDFLFPSEEDYRNPGFPAANLRMLAVKTTCRDRWRQVLNEAERIKVKHLLTLQEGISAKQHREMKDSGVRLVVPRRNFRRFRATVREDLTTLGDFIREVRGLREPAPTP